jgi:hypothetical protein
MLKESYVDARQSNDDKLVTTAILGVMVVTIVDE